jgi:hygromycin-B 7''-O-kinase
VDAPGVADAGRILAACGVRDEPLEPVHSYSSLVFRGPRFVVRLQPAHHRQLLGHEVRVLPALPPEVPHAEVVGHGREERFGWLVLRRLPGEQLGRCWPNLAPADRQAAVEQLGEAMARIHAVPEPGRFPHPWVEDPEPATYQQHPSRIGALAAAGRELPEVDRPLLDEVEAYVGERLDAFGPGEPVALVHADLHFENLLWDRARRRLTAVLDFEMSRPAAPDLDLNVVLRMCGTPALLVAEDYEDRMHPGLFDGVVGWLAAAYPALFAHPRLVERQEAYAALYALRSLVGYWRVGWERPWPVHELRDLVAGRQFTTRLLRALG